MSDNLKLPFEPDPADLAPIVQPPRRPRRPKGERPAPRPDRFLAGTAYDEESAVFHELNPHVLRLAISIARAAHARGVKRWGIRAVWEILRWTYLVTTGDIYKLNDHYHSWYARRIMADCPDLVGFFETRTSGRDHDERHDGLLSGAEASL